MSLRITEIAQAKKNTERVNIYLNGKFWIGLGKHDLVSLRLAKGVEISDLEKLQIESIATTGKLVDRAINYLRLRPRSCAEVRDYLVLKKGVEEGEANGVISLLEERGYLSDEKFAEWYANYKTSYGVNGLNKIKAELLKKRVDIKIINSLLEKLSSNDDFKNDQIEKIKEFANKVIKTIRAKDEYDLKAKLTQRLMSRGFKYDDVKKVIKEIKL
jgi:regulatory protein